MASVSCHGCGGALALSVHSPMYADCRACGSHTALPPEIVQRLAATGAELRAIDVGELQLSSRQVQRLQLQEASIYGTLYVYLLVGGFHALTLPFALVDVLSGEPTMSAISHLAVTLLLPVAFFVPFRAMRRVRARFEDSHAAQAPATPGGCATCHACGGELPSAPLAKGGVARCRYCAADNLLDAAVVARATARRRFELGIHEKGQRTSARWYGVVTAVARVCAFLAVPGVIAGAHLGIPKLVLACTRAGLDRHPLPRGVKFARVDGKIRVTDETGALLYAPRRPNGRRPRVELRSVHPSQKLVGSESEILEVFADAKARPRLLVQHRKELPHDVSADGYEVRGYVVGMWDARVIE